MLKASLLACLLVASLTWSIQKREEETLSSLSFSLAQQSLQFINDTSSKCLTQAQINMFIKAANDATKTYG